MVSPWRILSVCTEQMRQTKSFCVALPNWPRCQKLGETIFVSACGIQTIEANAVTADVCITLAVRSLTQRPLDLCRQPKHRQSFKKELERSRALRSPRAFVILCFGKC